MYLIHSVIIISNYDKGDMKYNYLEKVYTSEPLGRYENVIIAKNLICLLVIIHFMYTKIISRVYSFEYLAYRYHSVMF